MMSALRRKIATAVHSICGDGSPVSWEIDPDLGLGVELTVEGLRLSWGVDSYLDALERGVTAVLDQAPTLSKGRKKKQAGANAEAGKEADSVASTDAAASPTDGAEPEATPDPKGGAAPEAAPPADRKPPRARKPPKKGKARRRDTS
jgi:hypothetical protein